MKSILASLLLCSSFAFADGGGEGLSGPGDYYNPDVKCSVHDGVTLYIHLKPELRMTASVYNSRTNRVTEERVMLTDNMASGCESQLYQIENKYAHHGISYLAIHHHDFTILNAKGDIVSRCEILPGAKLDGPNFP